MTAVSSFPRRAEPRVSDEQARGPTAHATKQNRLTASVLRPSELDADLIALWKQFCTADPLYRSPFYWPQFTMVVAQVRSDARVAVFEQAGSVVGFLPFHLIRGAVGKPIGGQINDYHGPILAPGVTVTSAALLDAARLAAYDYNHLPAAFTALARGSRTAGYSPQIDLAHGFETYVASRDSRWTKAQREVRRRQRKTESEFGPIRFDWHDSSDAVFAQLVAMKNRQYARMGLKMRMASGWAGEVIAQLRHVGEPDLAGVTSALYAGDRLIAAHFGLRTAELLHWWFPAYDLALARLGPGINLVNQCAMAASEVGIRTIDFGRGDEDFKQHFANSHVALREGSLALPGSLAAHLRQGSDELVSVASRLPLGRYSAYPRKAVARLISGVTLPD